MVAEYVTGLKAAWDVAKALKATTDAIDDAHIKLQIAELINALADAKIEAAENAEKIAELEKQLKSKSSFLFENGMYYKSLENGEREGALLCNLLRFSIKGNKASIYSRGDLWELLLPNM